MKALLLAAAITAGTVTAASATDSIVLTPVQMDKVTAGATAKNGLPIATGHKPFKATPIKACGGVCYY